MIEELDDCELGCGGTYRRERVGPGPVGEPALVCDRCGDEVLLA